MNKVLTTDALGLPQRLFSEVDRNSAMSRYYDAQNKIAIAVAEYRYNHKLTQTALADKLGVTQAMVSKYESGDYNISLKAAFELFDKLGMRFDCAIEKDNGKPFMDFDPNETYISTSNIETVDSAEKPDDDPVGSAS